MKGGFGALAPGLEHERLADHVESIRLAFSEAPDAVFLKDLDGRFVWMNETCAEFLQVRGDEAIGCTAAELSDDPDHGEIELAERFVLKFGQARDSEEARTILGETYRFVFTRCPIRDGRGQIIGLLGIGRECSEMARELAEVKHREAGLLSAQQLVKVGSWELNVHQGQASWSPELYRLFNLDPERGPVPIEEFVQLIHPEDRSHVIDSFEKLFGDLPPRTRHVRTNPELGPIRFLEATTERRRDEAGRVVQAYGTLLDVTERVQTESALRKSEHRFSKLFRANPMAIAYSHLESGRLMDVNDQYAALLGYRREELIGASFLALYADAEDRLDLSRLIENPNSIHNLQVRFRRKSGEVRDALLSLEVLPLDDEMVLLSMLVDVTERKHAEEALVASENRIRTILETEPECVKVVDREGRLLDINPAGLKMIEADSLEMVRNQPVRSLIAAEFQDRFFKLHDIALDGGSGYLDFEIIGLKGRRVSVETHSVPFLDNSGSIVGVLSITRDVTARLKAESALRDSEERYRHMFESNPQPMWVYDLDTLKILAVNDAALEHYGYSQSEFVGRKVTQIRPEDEVEKVLEAIDGIREGKSMSGVWRYQKKSGALFHAEVRSHRIQWLGCDAVVVMATDVTEKLAAEEAIRNLNADLEHRVVERTEQMELANRELEAFCYSVSHDLRTPLRAISGFASALAEDYGGKLDAEALEYLSRINSGTQRMTEVINDLLRLSRVSRAEMKRQEINLSRIAHEIVSELRSASPDREVEVTIEPGLGAFADGGLARVALENLLHNAWKFTSKRETARIEFNAEEVDGHVVFLIKDDGAGFDMAYSNKLFGVFERLHRTGEFPGTGVGLATVSRIVQRHGGRIWAEAEVDKGATFYFTLPTLDGSPG